MAIAAHCLAVLLPWQASHATDTALQIVYPREESGGDPRHRYPVAVLELALRHTGQPFALHPSAAAMQQARSLRLLQHGDTLDIAWSVATAERDQALRVVPIAIDRGLIGWRVLLVRRGDAERFAPVDSVSALAAFSAGQGHDWPDAAALRANGMRVVESSSYDGLFRMLARGRFDCFPRGLSEAYLELDAHADLDFEVESTLLLHYRAGLYFFLHRERAALAALIEDGLQAAIDDGSLLELFEAQFGAQLARAGLAGRRVLHLDRSAAHAPISYSDAPPGWAFQPEAQP
ncbi:MAG: hypothetical protein KDJ14_01115 [Xanthomonadales bacterium]|nr:hypothetical protein [Xanthomonadales bacterium]